MARAVLPRTHGAHRSYSRSLNPHSGARRVSLTAQQRAASLALPIGGAVILMSPIISITTTMALRRPVSRLSDVCRYSVPISRRSEQSPSVGVKRVAVSAGRNADPVLVPPLIDRVTHFNTHLDAEVRFERAIRRSEERRVGKECRSRWSP